MSVNLTKVINLLGKTPVNIKAGTVPSTGQQLIIVPGEYLKQNVSWGIDLNTWDHLSDAELAALCILLYNTDPDTNEPDYDNSMLMMKNHKDFNKYDVVSYLFYKGALQEDCHGECIISDRGIFNVRPTSSQFNLNYKDTEQVSGKIIPFPNIVDFPTKKAAEDIPVTYRLLVTSGKILDKVFSLLNFTDYRVIVHKYIAEELNVSPNDVGTIMRWLVDSEILLTERFIKGRFSYKLNSKIVKIRRKPIIGVSA